MVHYQHFIDITISEAGMLLRLYSIVNIVAVRFVRLTIAVFVRTKEQ